MTIPTPSKSSIRAKAKAVSREELARRLKNAERLRSKMEAAAATGPKGKFEKAQREFLRPRSSAAAAVAEITKHQNRSLRSILELAEQVDPFRMCSERVVARWEPKTSGGGRLILAPGPVRKAAQLLAHTALAPVALTDDRLWMPKGRGRAACIERIVQELKAAPSDTHAILIDVKNFFGSIDREWLLSRLPLPRSVIEHTVAPLPESYDLDLNPIMALNEKFGGLRQITIPHQEGEDIESESASFPSPTGGSGNRTVGREDHEVSPSGQRPGSPIRMGSLCCGRAVYAPRRTHLTHEVVSWDDVHVALSGTLPQGSVVSPLAAQFAAVSVIERCPPDTFAAMYGDDLLVLARREEAERTRQDLLRSLRDCRSGRYSVSRSAVAPVTEGFTYLGCRFRLDADRVEVAPTERNLQKFFLKLRTTMLKGKLVNGRLKDARNQLNGWFGAFREWPQAAQLKRELLSWIVEVEQGVMSRRAA